jgi:hypothetical protein
VRVIFQKSLAQGLLIFQLELASKVSSARVFSSFSPPHLASSLPRKEATFETSCGKSESKRWLLSYYTACYAGSPSA